MASSSDQLLGAVSSLTVRLSKMESELALEKSENARLREHLATIESRIAPAAVRGEQVVHHQSTLLRDGFEMDPAHDPDVIEADRRLYLARFGRSAEDLALAERELKLALTAARLRIEATRSQKQPASAAELERVDQRTGQWQAPPPAGPDMSRTPAVPGRVMIKRPGQVTVLAPGEPSCPLGHLAQKGQRFCVKCGAKIGSPKLGEDWGDKPGQDQAIVEQRLREEGVIE